jgi:hypothetical protein
MSKGGHALTTLPMHFIDPALEYPPQEVKELQGRQRRHAELPIHLAVGVWIGLSAFGWAGFAALVFVAV